MDRLRAISSFALLLLSTATFAQNAPRLRVSCDRDSTITSSVNLEQLIQQFGKANVREQQVEIGEGETRQGIVLFAGIVDKEIAILPGSSAEPMHVVLRGERSQWVAAGGITLGTHLKQIERLNGRPFVLTGFDWDYSGTVVDWKGGKLQPPSECSFQPRLDYGRVGSTGKQDEIARQVLGDKDYSSSHPAMQALNPQVYEIVITFYK